MSLKSSKLTATGKNYSILIYNMIRFICQVISELLFLYPTPTPTVEPS